MIYLYIYTLCKLLYYTIYILIHCNLYSVYIYIITYIYIYIHTSLYIYIYISWYIHICWRNHYLSTKTADALTAQVFGRMYHFDATCLRGCSIVSSGFHGMGLDSYYYSNVKSSNPLKDSEKEDLSLF